MIDYEKLQDAQIKDLISEEAYKYYCMHVPIKKRYSTIREFAEVLDNGCFDSHVNIETAEKVVIPYLIETGALTPSMEDPINYASIQTPRLYHRVRWYHKPNGYGYRCLIHPDENRQLLTIRRIKEIYFDDNGNFKLSDHQENSAYTKDIIVKLYNYMQKCEDCPTKDLEDVRRYLTPDNIFSDEEIENIFQ